MEGISYVPIAEDITYGFTMVNSIVGVATSISCRGRYEL